MDSGVNITACTMSMDVMGISEEELIDGINITLPNHETHA
ncbi:MAG: DsrE/DsrF/DrsH-like family protein [Prevotella sp.]